LVACYTCSLHLSCKNIIILMNKNDADNHESYSRDNEQVQQVLNANESHERNEQISCHLPRLQMASEGSKTV
jgi:hypothetical protein